MPYVSTLTTKGQIVIPSPVREILGLRVADKFFFEIESGRIIIQQIPSIDDAMGMIKTEKYISKKEFKQSIAKQVIKKYS
jgi:AbrB family looped-hinge helix DNA binding protein